MKLLLLSLALLLSLLSFPSCDKCKGIACFTPPPNYVECLVVDKNGKDLLNPSSIIHFDTSKIQVFTVVNGQNTLMKHQYAVSQNSIRVICKSTWLMGDLENQIQIRLDSSNIETLKYTLVEVHSDCCTFFRFGKKVINEKEVADKSSVFTIIK